MKNVWILNHYAVKPSDRGGTRHFHLASHLRDFGWQASIIAASYQGDGGQRLFALDEFYRLESHANVLFLWIRTPAYKGNGFGRMLNMLSYSGRVLLPRYTSELPKPDVIIGSSVHPFAALAGALLARRHRVPFIFEVRDLWPQTLIDMGAIRERSFITWALRKLELWLYREATKIVVLLPRAVDYIAPLGIAAEKVVWIPNGVDLSEYPASPPRQRNECDPFVFMYFGAHGQANGLDVLLNAMKLITHLVSPDMIKLRMVGDGPLKDELIQLARKLELNNVSFELPVPKKMIPSLSSEADAFIITVLDLPRLYRYGISMNKLFDYLAAARPIVIASNAVNNPVDEAGSGITVPPDNPEALAQAILEVSRMSDDERHRMGCAGRRYVAAQHDFQHLGRCLAAVLDGMLNRDQKQWITGHSE